MKFASFVALMALVTLQGAAPPPDDAATIIGISTARLHAISVKDAVSLARYTSRTPQFVNANGAISNEVHVEVRYPDLLRWSGTPQVRFIGGAALLTGNLHEVEVFPSGSVITDFVKTELYAKEDGRWMLQAGQSTTVPHNHATPISNAPANLRAFVGRYRWVDREIDTIALQGNRLSSALDGSPDPVFFVGQNSVTYPDDLGVTSFYYNRNHSVAGYVYRRCDGQTVRAVKLP